MGPIKSDHNEQMTTLTLITLSGFQYTNPMITVTFLFVNSTVIVFY
jgi:hypothetical protein